MYECPVFEGHARDENGISQPRAVSALKHKDSGIQLLSGSDAATAVFMSRGDVFTLHQYQCHKIISKSVSILFC